MINAIIQGVLLGGYYALIAFRTIVHVLGHAHHQSRAR